MTSKRYVIAFTFLFLFPLFLLLFLKLLCHMGCKYHLTSVLLTVLSRVFSPFMITADVLQ